MSPKKIQLLNDKKYRKETGLFLVEGEKNIIELLRSDLTIETVLGTKEFLNAYKNEFATYQASHDAFDLNETTEDVLIKTGSLQSNNAGIAVVRQRVQTPLTEITRAAKQDLILVLDDIRDPGNLGTIIRTADWYGVTHMVASETTADMYNPKVVASSMGSYTRMQVSYTNLASFLQLLSDTDVPIITADMEGVSTHKALLPTHGALVMGSESHGISDISKRFATHTVTIPRFGNAESLNVSVATGILLDTIRRAQG